MGSKIDDISLFHKILLIFGVALLFFGGNYSLIADNTNKVIGTINVQVVGNRVFENKTRKGHSLGTSYTIFTVDDQGKSYEVEATAEEAGWYTSIDNIKIHEYKNLLGIKKYTISQKPRKIFSSRGVRIFIYIAALAIDSFLIFLLVSSIRKKRREKI